MALARKTLLTGLVTAVPSLMILASGVMKLLGAEQVRTALTGANMLPYMRGLCVMELLFTALFIYPKTMKLGLLLLTSYFAGAIAVDLSYARPMVPAVAILTLVWVAAFLRDRTAFLPVSEAAM